MSNKVIDQLRNDANYYGRLGESYLSNSDIYSLLNNPRDFRKKEKGLPLIMGGYFHCAMLEPEKLKDYPTLDVTTRSTKAFKEYILEHSLDPYDVLLNKEVDTINTWIDAMKSNFKMYTDIYNENNIYEEPGVAELFGMKWKGKADIITDTHVIDIKTSANIDKWKWSANDYNYDSQAYIYQQIFGKPVIFYVVDKKSLRLKIAQPVEDTLLRGRDKVIKAIEIYNKFFSEDSEEDLTQYIEYEEF